MGYVCSDSAGNVRTLLFIHLIFYVMLYSMILTSITNKHPLNNPLQTFVFLLLKILNNVEKTQ